jgi:phage gpG-like protein
MPHGGVTVKSSLKEVLGALTAKPRHVAVGVIGERSSETHKDAGGATVADVAHWNYYGVGQGEHTRIPARPFIAIAVERHADEIKRIYARVTRGVIEQKLGVDQALGLLGEVVVGFVKQTIADGVPPPNAPSTIARKGSSTPLINTGQLRGSITWQVREGKGT